MSEVEAFQESSAETHYSRGYSLRKQGCFKEAIAEYSSAISLKSQYFKALFARAFAYDKVRHMRPLLISTDPCQALEGS
jgi:tetratricopeptide (TPR) repeat protein